MTVIKKAIVKSYDAATHKAAVQIAGSLGVWLEGIRVATDIPAADVVVDRQCTVLFIDPSNQDDALVLTIQGELPSGDGAGAPAGNTVVSETSFGQASNKGTSTQYSRRDHTHGSPTDPVPAHSASADPHSPYALTPVLHDVIVDGVGSKTGHHAQITGAISAGGVNIFVKPKPSAGRYDAFTVASGDAVKAIVGAGPGILVGAITIEKIEVFLSDLEANGRVTLKSAFCNFLRIICRATSDTGFTFVGIPTPAGHTTLTDCAVMESNAGIAFDLAAAIHGIRLVNCGVRNFTGQHVIKALDPDSIVVGLNVDGTVAPTQEPFLLDGTGGSGGPFIIANSDLGCLVTNTYNCVKATEIGFLLLQGLSSVADAADGTPAIELDHVLGSYICENILSSASTLFDVPSSSTGLTILKGCLAGSTLVTGTGAYEIRECKQGAAAVGNRYTSYNLLRAADNTGAIGTFPVAWAQINAYIHRIRNYVDFKNVSTPGDPATSGVAQASREYTRAIDADNDGLFIKIKKAGAISEVQIA